MQQGLTRFDDTIARVIENLENEIYVPLISSLLILKIRSLRCNNLASFSLLTTPPAKKTCP